MADLLGHTVGPYRLESVVGNGRTGDVYCGTHTSTGKQAAVKVLRAAIAVGVEFPERFVTEMRTVSTLHHPNIVALYDFGVADGVCFIALEVMRSSVRALLRLRPPAEPLPLTLAVNLVSQAAEGLAYAHQHGVIHRDIQPSNLLLDDIKVASLADNDGNDRDDGDDADVLKVTDFGLARLAAGASMLTSSGAALGSGVMLGAPAYMSPELCRGHALDERSDLYALGVVLYEMTTGVLPFPVIRLEDAIREHLYSPPPLPRLLNPEIPALLERVMLRCLAKHPDDRFDTATDLVRALRAAVPEA